MKIDKILEGIKGVFTAGGEAADNLITSDEERGQIKIKLDEIQMKILELFHRLSIKVVLAELGGDSWLQRNWRPLTMLTFVVLIAGDMFGLLVKDLPEYAYDVIKLGLGGYVVGRSVEKISKNYYGGNKKNDH